MYKLDTEAVLSELERADSDLFLQFPELLDQLAFLVCQTLGDLDPHMHLVVAALGNITKTRNSTLCHEEGCTRLSPGRDLELHRPINSGHLDLGSRGFVSNVAMIKTSVLKITK